MYPSPYHDHRLEASEIFVPRGSPCPKLRCRLISLKPSYSPFKPAVQNSSAVQNCDLAVSPSVTVGFRGPSLFRLAPASSVAVAFESETLSKRAVALPKMVAVSDAQGPSEGYTVLSNKNQGQHVGTRRLQRRTYMLSTANLGIWVPVGKVGSGRCKRMEC